MKRKYMHDPNEDNSFTDEDNNIDVNHESRIHTYC